MICKECGGAFEYEAPRPGQMAPRRCEDCRRASRARRVALVGRVSRIGPRYCFVTSGNQVFLIHDAEFTLAVGQRIRFVVDPTDRADPFTGRVPIGRSPEVL